MTTMSGQQAEALARFLVSLRPGQRAWTKAAVYDALTDAAREHTPDTLALTTAATKAALDPKVVTPAVIAMTGRHWEADRPEQHPTAVAANTVTDRCARCGGLHATAAPCNPRDHERATGADFARQALREALGRRTTESEDA